MKKLRPAVINSAPYAHSYGVEGAGEQNIQRHARGEESVQRPMTLLERCKTGDEQAWTTFVSDYATRVYRWAALFGLSRPEAEDAAQEVFATAARRIHTCQGEEIIPSWLFQVTRRVVANTRRLAWCRCMLLMSEPAEPLEPSFSYSHPRDMELELEVRHGLRAIPLPHAEILILMDIEGFTRDETARALKIPPGTVASRLRKARAVLRETMDMNEHFIGGAPQPQGRKLS